MLATLIVCHLLECFGVGVNKREFALVSTDIERAFVVLLSLEAWVARMLLEELLISLL